MSIHAIAKSLCRDRHTIRREIRRRSVVQRRENSYASRNPQVPDYRREGLLLGCWGACLSREQEELREPIQIGQMP
ncbi:MAG: hypothetical protein LBB86_01070 [Oscillospiraceae bacterium]|nr:hypothetical protein [Oscillospiraceae bacterium]